MLSRSGSVFYGDIRSHDRMPVPFSSFISLCKKGRQMHGDAFGGKRSQEDACGIPEFDSTEALSSYLEDDSQIYLAQVPLINKDREGESPLRALLEDIHMPKFLEENSISSINLWMNMMQSRSSTHYDPHHNLLCVVAGCKQVTLWPPSATPFLYPMPVCGEASNHSAVDLVNPNFKVHSRAKNAWDHCQNVTLHPGDALFIPEGWFHQVDSDDLTIAVNFWWPSKIMLAMQTHMDAYYLRRIVSRLVDSEKEQILKAVSVINEDVEERQKSHHRPSTDSDEEKKDKKTYAHSTNYGECRKVTSFDKYNLNGESYSLLVDNRWRNDHDRMISSELECATSDGRSMEQKQLLKQCDTNVQTPEIQSSMVMCSSVDGASIPPNLPQEPVGIVEKEQNGGVMFSQSGDPQPCSADLGSSRWKLNRFDFKNRYVLQELDSFESHSLHVLISSVHAKMGDAVRIQSPEPIQVGAQHPSQKGRTRHEFGTFGPPVTECSNSQCLNSHTLEDDPVADILGRLRPSTLQKLLLVMVNKFPRTLEALIIQGLSPIAAEILTHKFDEVDKEATKEEREEFYRLFYSIFDDQLAAMEVILNGKESFGFLALKKVMEFYLGLTCEQPKN